MARMMMCDAADDREAAYLVTDLSSGDAAAWCQEHFTDLCAAVTRAAEEAIAADTEPVAPQDVDGPTDELQLEHDVQLPPGNSADVPHVGGLVIDEQAAADYAESNHRDRTRRKLAERPDSAATSLDVVPEPGPPRR